MSAVRPDRTAPKAIARQVRAQLAARRADCVGLAQLAIAMGIGQTDLVRVVRREDGLGLGGPQQRPLVWAVTPVALPAGFRPVYSRGRMVLQLGSPAGVPWPLVVSGAQLASAFDGDLTVDELTEHGGGFGELGHAITRLSLMAQRWLTLPAPPRSPMQLTRRLLTLIAKAWQASPGPVASSGRLHVHRSDLKLPIGTRFWQHDAETSELELVVWADKEDGFTLVNVYPGGTYDAIFGAGGRS